MVGGPDALFAELENAIINEEMQWALELIRSFISNGSSFLRSIQDIELKQLFILGPWPLIQIKGIIF